MKLVIFSRFLECFLDIESVKYKNEEKNNRGTYPENQLAVLLTVTEKSKIGKVCVREELEVSDNPL